MPPSLASRLPAIFAGSFLIITTLVISGPGYAQPSPVESRNQSQGQLHQQFIEELRNRNPLETRADKNRLGHELALLNREYKQFSQRSRQPGVITAFRSGNSLLQIKDDQVVIDVVAEHDVNVLRAELESLGMQNIAVFGRQISGLLPVAQLELLDALTSVRLARAAMAGLWTGAVTSQGDLGLNSDDTRAGFGIDGTGVTVGSLSDSYNCLGGAGADIASDDLPVGISVLAEELGCSSGTDEGRAMMQIVHDIAPGADQAFHSAFNGMADFASGIIELHTIAGADIINDDVFYFAEPFFQDGAIAQAVDTVKSMGVAYFSSAGNQADQAYSTNFSNSGQAGFRIGSMAHDFDAGPGIDTRQSLTIPGNSQVIFVLQWDQPFFSVSGAPGSASDVDIVLYPSGGGPALAGGLDNNLGGDAVEIFSYTNNSNTSETVDLGIDLVSGPPPNLMMYQYFGNLIVNEYVNNSPTITGHANAAGARAVGAVRYLNTPAFGVSPPIREYFSSLGGVPILFDLNGLPVLELRQKPEIMAPNGGDNTFFGTDFEGNGWPNFFGTSASAPHAAGVAALMREYDPAASVDRLYAALQATAIDMDTAGIDNNSGHGLIDAQAAVSALTPVTLDTAWVPPPATQGQFYWWQGLSVAGGLPPYSWTVVSGWLPFPLTLNQAGVISGIPISPATANFTVEVTDALASSATVTTQIVIAPNSYVCGACHE